MLVLSRKVGEKIHIGEDITVMVMGIDLRGKVRIGIDAPREVAIYRQELRPHFEKPRVELPIDE